jgi:hypothetical protein
VRDADVLFVAFKAAGAPIVHALVDRDYYGNREFAVCDPDGCIIAFAHSIAAKAKRGGGGWYRAPGCPGQATAAAR